MTMLCLFKSKHTIVLLVIARTFMEWELEPLPMPFIYFFFAKIGNISIKRGAETTFVGLAINQQSIPV